MGGIGGGGTLNIHNAYGSLRLRSRFNDSSSIEWVLALAALNISSSSLSCLIRASRAAFSASNRASSC